MGVFSEAYSAVESVEELVKSRINDAVNTTKSLQEVALQTISDLQDVNLNFDRSGPPPAPSIDTTIDIGITLPEVAPKNFGEIAFDMPTLPTLDAMPAMREVEIPEYDPSITGLVIPDPPAVTDLGALPTKPVLDPLTFPVEPDFVLPPVPIMDDITTPTFSGLQLPEFNATLPEWEGTALVDILQWSEPTYHVEILDEAMDTIRRMWAGELGIPAAVEQAMYERAMSREDLAVEREVAAVATEFSSRGFSLPSGLEAARVDQLRNDLAVKKLALNRELTIELVKIHVENVRFGVQQAVACETVLVNLFLNMAARLFEAAKFHIESQLRIHDAMVTLFNAKMSAYQVRASVFDVLVRAEISKIEAFKAEVDAEIAKGTLNEQRVRVYTAIVAALQNRIEIYKAQMQGVSVKAEIQRSQVAMYGEEIRAYAERINSDKLRFDAYESRIKGEVAKAGIIDSEARAYAALVQGKVSIQELEIKKADLVLQRNEHGLRIFLAQLEAEKAKMTAQLSAIQEAVAVYQADTQRFTAVAGVEVSKAELKVKVEETEMRTSIAFYEAKVRSYIANMEQMIRQAEVSLKALEAAGQLSTTLAAGAMAGVHVGASLSGGGSVSAGGSYSSSESNSKSYSESHNYEYEGVGKK